MKGLIAISAILAAAAPPGEAPPPDRQQIEAAAARCGLPANFLRVGGDSSGDYADVSPNGDLDRLDANAFLCLIGWAERTGARIGFISEPPPGAQTIAQGPIDSIRRAAKAARDCGLPVHIDPLSPGEAVLDARRDAPSGPLECTRSWIEKQRDLRWGFSVSGTSRPGAGKVRSRKKTPRPPADGRLLRPSRAHAAELEAAIAAWIDRRPDPRPCSEPVEGPPAPKR